MPRYYRSNHGYSGSRNVKPAPDYNDKYVLGIVQGMFDEWSGSAASTANDDAILTGQADPGTQVKLRGNALGREVGQRLRGIVQRGQVPGSQADEFGYFVAGTKQGFADAALNMAGQAINSATLGAVNPGDAGGVEDEIMAVLGF